MLEYIEFMLQLLACMVLTIVVLGLTLTIIYNVVETYREIRRKK